MRRLIAIAALLLVVILLGVAQLVLPGLAESRLRDRLSAHGTVLSVEVDAFPAIELLWHHADRVVVRMQSYRSGTSALGTQLAQAADVGSLSASVAELQAGLLTLRDATLRKHGDALIGRAQVNEADLRAAVPILESVRPIASDSGQLTLRGTASLLGVAATIDATVAAVGGQIVVQPDVPFGALATITVFTDPHVYVQSITAAPDAGGFVVSGTARLR